MTVSHPLSTEMYLRTCVKSVKNLRNCLPGLGKIFSWAGKKIYENILKIFVKIFGSMKNIY